MTLPRSCRAVGRARAWQPAVSAGVLAFVVRVVVVLAQPLRLVNDSADYQRLAVSLSEGHGFGVSILAPAGGPTAFRPPLFPLLLGVVYRLAGVHLLAARLVEAALGAGLVYVVVRLTEMMWGRTVAWVAGGIAAVYPSLVIASTSLMSEALSLPLEMTAVAAALVYRRNPSARWLVLAGATLGLDILTRPNSAVIALPLILLVWRGWRPRRLLGPATLLLVATVVVLPWVVRDRAVLGRWVPVTTQDGFVLSGTYNQSSLSDQHYPAAWRPVNADPARLQLVRSHPTADEVTLNDLLLHEARDFADRHPGYVLKVGFENTKRLVDLGGLAYTRREVTTEFAYPAGFGTAEIVGCFLVMAFAAVGLCTRRPWRAPWPYWTVPLLLWLTMAFIEILPRYRAVIDPFLVQAAALGVLSSRRLLSRSPRAPAAHAAERLAPPADGAGRRGSRTPASPSPPSSGANRPLQRDSRRSPVSRTDQSTTMPAVT